MALGFLCSSATSRVQVGKTVLVGLDLAGNLQHTYFAVCKVQLPSVARGSGSTAKTAAQSKQLMWASKVLRVKVVVLCQLQFCRCQTRMSVLPLFQFKEVKARETAPDPMKFMCLTPAHPRLLLVEGGVTQTSSAQDEEKTSLNLKLYTPNPRTARPAEASTETQEKDAHGTAESPNSSDAAD